MARDLNFLVTPLLVCQWRAIQFGTPRLPAWQEPIHLLPEMTIVMPMAQVHKFVNDDVLEATSGLLGELEIQPDPAYRFVTAAPSGLHSLDAHFMDRRTNAGLPLVE